MESTLGSGNRLLRERIRKENPSLAKELENLWESALRKIHEFQSGKTGQGTLHCLKVENNIGLLLQDKLDKFKDIDLFALSASAALHDIGKIERQDKSETDDHGLQGKELLLSPGVWSEFFQDWRKAQAVAHIIGVHDNGQIDELPEDEFVIDSPPGLLLRSLAAIFRLADMLDTTYTRSPYIMRIIKAMKFVKFPEAWFARGAIGGWKIHFDGKTIILQVSCSNEDEKSATITYVDMLNEAITNSHRKYLENCPVLYWEHRGRPWTKATLERATVNFSFRFQLSGLEHPSPPGDLSNLYEPATKEYLRHLAWDLSEVNLDGLGEFRNRQSTSLMKLFIDVDAKLSAEWKPGIFTLFEEYEESENTDERRKVLIRTVSELEYHSLPVMKVVNDDKLRRLVILGEPGSGKSTVGQFLCLKASEECTKTGRANVIPFRVIVRNFVSEKKKRAKDYTIIDHIFEETESHLRSKCPRGFVEYCLTQKRSVVIFDGIDETPRLEDREQVCNEIMSFAGRFEETKCIVTSRIVGYGQVPLVTDRFLHIELEPLKPNQVKEFVVSWYEERELDPKRKQVKTKSLLKALENPEAGKLARNPLLLTMMALVHKAEADLPRQRAVLYEKIVEAFLVNRDRAKGLVHYNETEIRQYHEYLGYWMHSKGQKEEKEETEVGISELREKMVEFIGRDSALPLSLQEKKVEEFIDTARKRNGLIVERGQGIFVFGHRSIQEYFAASHFTSTTYGINQLWDTLSDKIFDPYWHEVILLLAGRLGLVSVKGLNELVSRILETKPEKRSLLLAAEIANDKTPISGHLLVSIADQLMETLLDKEIETAEIAKCVQLLTGLMDTEVRDCILSTARKASKEGKHSTRTFQIYSLVKRASFSSPNERLLADSLFLNNERQPKTL